MRRNGRTEQACSLGIIFLILAVSPLRASAAPSDSPPPLGAKGQTAAPCSAASLSSAVVGQPSESLSSQRLLGAKGQTAQAHELLHHGRAAADVRPPVWPPARIRRTEPGAGETEVLANRTELPPCATSSGPGPGSRALARRLARTTAAPLGLLPPTADPLNLPARPGPAGPPGFGACYDPGVSPSALLQHWSC